MSQNVGMAGDEHDAMPAIVPEPAPRANAGDETAELPVVVVPEGSTEAADNAETAVSAEPTDVDDPAAVPAESDPDPGICEQAEPDPAPEPEPEPEPVPDVQPEPEPASAPLPQQESDDTVVVPVVPAPPAESAPTAESADSAAPPTESARGDAAPAAHARSRGRRRWPWVVLAGVLALLVLVSAAGLWYVSGLIGDGARVPQPDAGFAMTVTSVDGGAVGYDGVAPGWVDQGLMGIATAEGGYLQTADPNVSGTRGTRTVTDEVLPPAPVVGDAAALDGWYFPRNPRIGLGLDYRDVEYDSPLGPTPAWLVPGTSKTWVIFTHGRGASPLEGLRIARTVAEQGYPMLLIRYRNDAFAPAGTGYAQFGADEWQDLEAAVQYAVDNGADRVVLAGASMGGSITLAFLQNSPLADRVAGAFLDSPLTDFGEVVREGAADMGLPGFVADLGMRVAAWRYGFDWAATDYASDAARFTTPMLVVQGTADATVPPQVTEAFAAAADPDVVRLELVDGAGHVQSWNVDRPRYEALLSGFLARVAPPE